MNAKKAGNEIRTGAIVVAVLATLFPVGCATASTGTAPVGPAPPPPSPGALGAPQAGG